MSVCSSCGSYTNDYTWLRQRIICRTCWEISGHDQVMVVSHSGICQECGADGHQHLCECEEE